MDEANVSDMEEEEASPLAFEHEAAARAVPASTRIALIVALLRLKRESRFKGRLARLDSEVSFLRGRLQHLTNEQCAASAAAGHLPTCAGAGGFTDAGLSSMTLWTNWLRSAAQGCDVVQAGLALLRGVLLEPASSGAASGPETRLIEDAEALAHVVVHMLASAREDPSGAAARGVLDYGQQLCQAVSSSYLEATPCAPPPSPAWMLVVQRQLEEIALQLEQRALCTLAHATKWLVGRARDDDGSSASVVLGMQPVLGAFAYVLGVMAEQRAEEAAVAASSPHALEWQRLLQEAFDASLQLPMQHRLLRECILNLAMLAWAGGHSASYLPTAN